MPGWTPVREDSAPGWKRIPDKLDQIQSDLESRPRMGILDQAKALGSLAISPVTGLLALPRQVGEALTDPGAAARRNLNPETAANLYGAAGHDPAGEAYGSAVAALAMAKGTPSIDQAAIDRLKAAGPQEVATPGATPKGGLGIVDAIRLVQKLRKLTPGKLADAAIDATLNHIEDITKPPKPPAPPPEATAAVDPILEHIARAKANVQAQVATAPKAPRGPDYYGVAPKTPTPAAAPAAGADYLMPAPEPQIPAGASPSQMATFSPQAVLDYMRGQASPVPETPSEAVSASPKGKVATIPAPEPEFAAETYKAAAQVKKANATAKWLNENGIDYDTFRSQMEAATPEMRESTLKEAARLSGENQLNSPESLNLMLLELKQLSKQSKLARLPSKASKAAQDLGTLE